MHIFLSFSVCTLSLEENSSNESQQVELYSQCVQLLPTPLCTVHTRESIYKTKSNFREDLIHSKYVKLRQKFLLHLKQICDFFFFFF